MYALILASILSIGYAATLGNGGYPDKRRLARFSTQDVVKVENVTVRVLKDKGQLEVRYMNKITHGYVPPARLNLVIPNGGFADSRQLSPKTVKEKTELLTIEPNLKKGSLYEAHVTFTDRAGKEVYRTILPFRWDNIHQEDETTVRVTRDMQTRMFPKFSYVPTSVLIAGVCAAVIAGVTILLLVWCLSPFRGPCAKGSSSSNVDVVEQIIQNAGERRATQAARYSQSMHGMPFAQNYTNSASPSMMKAYPM